MKGVVFTEFLDLVEDKFGYEMVDRIIQESELPSGGAYTSIGTYPFAEMAKLLGRLSHHTDIPINQLFAPIREAFFSVLLRSYPHFMQRVNGSFQLFESIDQYIHVEVKKLYPDAELPRFETNRRSDTELEMTYYSERKMGDFALGLIESTLEYYGETGTVEKTILNEEGTKVQFLVTKDKR